MARMTLRAKGQLTLPEEIRKVAHLEEGDMLEAELAVRAEGDRRESGVVLDD